jgi:hypothetical protein
MGIKQQRNDDEVLRAVEAATAKTFAIKDPAVRHTAEQRAYAELMAAKRARFRRVMAQGRRLNPPGPKPAA